MRRYLGTFAILAGISCGDVGLVPEEEPASASGKADGIEGCETACEASPEAVCSDADWCWLAPEGFSNRLTDVDVLQDGSVLAVGDHGSFVKVSKGTIEVTVSDEPLLLRAVIEANNGSVWAVGTQGRIVERVGESWVHRKSPTTADLSDVWLGPEGELWAAGENVVLRHDGADWAVLREGQAMGGVRGYTAPDGQVWIALGDQSYAEVLRWDGQGFETEFTGSPAGGQPRGVDITGDERGRIFALLTRATSIVRVREPGSASWSTLLDDRQPAEEDLHVAEDGTLVLGGRTSVRGVEGGIATKDELAPKGILAVAQSPDGGLWAVGENGLVARRIHDRWEQFSGLPWDYEIPAVSALARAPDGLWVGRDRPYRMDNNSLEAQGLFEERIGHGRSFTDFEVDDGVLWALHRDDIRDLTEVWKRSASGEWVKSLEAPAIRSLWLSPEGTLWAAGAKFVRETGPSSGEWANEIYRLAADGWEVIEIAEGFPLSPPSFTDVHGEGDDFVVLSGSFRTTYHGAVQILYIIEDGEVRVETREDIAGPAFGCVEVSDRKMIHICNGHRVLTYDGDAFRVEAEFPYDMYPAQIEKVGTDLVMVGTVNLAGGHAGFVATSHGGDWDLQWPGVSGVSTIWGDEDGGLLIGGSSGALLSQSP